MASKYLIAAFESKNGQKFYDFENPIQGERYFFNIIAKTRITTEDNVASSREEYEVIPYKPIEIRIPAQKTITFFALMCYLFIAILFVSAAVYYYR